MKKYMTREEIYRSYPDRDCREDFLDWHEYHFGVKHLWRNKHRIPREMMEAERKLCEERGETWKEPKPYEPRPVPYPYLGVDEVWEEDDTGVMRKVWSKQDPNKEIQNENT